MISGEVRISHLPSKSGHDSHIENQRNVASLNRPLTKHHRFSREKWTAHLELLELFKVQSDLVPVPMKFYSEVPFI